MVEVSGRVPLKKAERRKKSIRNMSTGSVVGRGYNTAEKDQWSWDQAARRDGEEGGGGERAEVKQCRL